MNKKGKIKLLVLVSITLLITMLFFLSALSPANTLEYSNNDLDVAIKSNLDQEIGKVSLKSHPSVDYMKRVPKGEQVVMWYEFNFDSIYENGLGEIEFIEVDTGKKVNREYSFVSLEEKTILMNKNVCDNSLNDNGTLMKDNCREEGTEEVKINEWVEYDSNDILGEKQIIGVLVNVQRGDKIDVNEDGFYDLEVSVEEITGSSSSKLMFKEIYEEIVSDVQEDVEEESKEENNLGSGTELDIEEPKVISWWAYAILAALIGLTIGLYFSHRGHKPKK